MRSRNGRAAADESARGAEPSASRALRRVRLRLELRVGQKTRRVFRRLEQDQAVLTIELHLRGERQGAVPAAAVREVELDHRVIELRSGGRAVGRPWLDVVPAEAFIGHDGDPIAFRGGYPVGVLDRVAEAP